MIGTLDLPLRTLGRRPEVAQAAGGRDSVWTRAVWRPRPRGSPQRAASRPSSASASASSVVRLPGAAVLRLDSRLPPRWRRVGLDCAWSACGLKFFSNWLRLGSPRGPDCPLELGPQGAEGGSGGRAGSARPGTLAPRPPRLGSPVLHTELWRTQGVCGDSARVPQGGGRGGEWSPTASGSVGATASSAQRGPPLPGVVGADVAGLSLLRLEDRPLLREKTTVLP